MSRLTARILDTVAAQVSTRRGTDLAVWFCCAFLVQLQLRQLSMLLLL